MTRVRLHVGTYDAAGGRGLYPLDYAPGEGFRLGEPYEGAANASFGAFSARHDLHYLVDEQAAGTVGVHRCTGDDWEALVRVASEGREPCYVALDPAATRLAVANYASGSLALLYLGETGIPSGSKLLWANSGSGPNAERQQGPHLHCVQFSPDGRWLYAVDLGADEVLRFPAGASGALTLDTLAYKAPPGSGPRHLLFHPEGRIALLVSELASTLSLFDVTDTGLVLRQRVSTLPEDFAGESLGGHLAINAAGDRIYVSNRGHDSIAVFAFDSDRGTLALLQHVASEGASPRFFLLLEGLDRLVLVNEEGGNIVALAVADDGLLSPTGEQCALPGPAFLLRT